jgi:hypothetical protein
MKFRVIALVTAVFFLGSLPLWGQQTAKDGKEYETLVTKLKAGDTSIDFKALRIAYTKTKEYRPYGGSSEDPEVWFAAINRHDFTVAAAGAERGLRESYIDINAHAVAALAYAGLGEATKAAFHKAVYFGLTGSILGSGDGKTPETAYVVIAADEIYVLLRGLGFLLFRSKPARYRPASLRCDGGHRSEDERQVPGLFQYRYQHESSEGTQVNHR